MKNGKHFKRYTVTSALPYANGPSHIGHFAGAYLPADIFVRFLRSQGKDVVYICGSDEHGTAIAIQARKEGISPKEIVDKYDTMLRETFAKFNISFDIYSRTSNPKHHETAQEFFQYFYDNDLLIQKSSEQLYDEEAKMFLADRFVMGTCPNCGNEEAYGNQCERCGKDLSPAELINPVSTLSGKTPVLKKTTHWFLPLNDYQDWLSDYILKEHAGDWKSNVLGQAKSWLQDGLQPRAITRDLDWGVKVPVPEGEGKVLYVWFDAPIGYISMTKEWAEQNGKDWRPYWQDEDTALVHFIGKDNIVFHTIIFPAILKGRGGYVIPENVPANEFLNLEENKISTSKGWAVWMHKFAEDYPDKIDVLRYTLTAIMPENKDADFTWTEFHTRNDKELVDTFGNFVNRVKVLTRKNFEGVPPRGPLTDLDRETMDSVHAATQKVADNIMRYRFREALNEMMNIARAGDLYLSKTEPWKMVKQDKAGAGHVLNIGLNIAAILAVAAEPFMPDTSKKVFEMLNIEPLRWTDLGGFDFVPEGGQIENIDHLFKRLDPKTVANEVQKLEDRKAEIEAAKSKTPPFKNETTFDDFQKMDIRIATVIHAEKIKKSRNLLKLRVDTGRDQRTVVSGVSEHFKPEDLVGKQVTLLANLAPRKIMGVESQGMILFAEDSDGKLHLLNPGHEVEKGSTVN